MQVPVAPCSLICAPLLELWQIRESRGCDTQRSLKKKNEWFSFFSVGLFPRDMEEKLPRYCKGGL